MLSLLWVSDRPVMRLPAKGWVLTVRKSKFGSKDLLCDAPENAVGPVGYVSECGSNKPATHRWRSLIKRYVYGELAIHLRLREGPLLSADEPCATEYGVVFYRPALMEVLRPNCDRPDQRWKRELERLQRCANEMDRAVLVTVVEFLQMPQRTRCGALPCAAVSYRKGLFRQDEIGCITPEILQVLRGPAVVSGPVLKDGELQFTTRRWRSPVALDVQLVNDVIKGRSDVVDDFADSDAPHQIRFCDGDNSGRDCFSLAIEIDNCAVGARVIAGKEDLNVSIETVDLLPCTLPL